MDGGRLIASRSVSSGGGGGRLLYHGLGQSLEATCCSGLQKTAILALGKRIIGLAPVTAMRCYGFHKAVFAGSNVSG
jgi:hypothetical protein